MAGLPVASALFMPPRVARGQGLCSSRTGAMAGAPRVGAVFCAYFWQDEGGGP